MGVKVITPFEKIDMVQNTTDYSVVYSMRDLLFGITDQELAVMIIASSDTASNSVTITMEGSLDGANWESVAIISTTDIGDGNADWAAINMGKPYGFIQFKVVENNNGAVVDLLMYVGYPTSEIAR